MNRGFLPLFFLAVFQGISANALKCRANHPGEVEFAPHPDCGKYYVCEGDRLIEMRCPAGLHFNTALNVCDYPERANCGGDVPSEAPVTTQEPTPAPTHEPTTSDGETGNKPNGNCRANNPGEVEFAPHPDCGKYYVCEGDRLIEMRCPAGLHFNTVLNVCDYPERANCNGDVPPSEAPAPTQEPTAVPTQEPTPAPTQEPTTSDGESGNKPSGNCRANKPGEVEFAPHPDCGKYYVCEGDRLIEMRCPAGLHFNTALNVCDYPERANCNGDVPPSEGPAPTQEPTLAPTHEPTTSDGETGNKPNGNCRANNPGEVEFAPHPDCGKYFVCEGDRLTEMRCPAGLHFNTILNVCDYPERAGCRGSENHSTGAPTENVPETTESAVTDAPQTGVCRANKLGEVEFASHEDCSKYYVCEHGGKIEMNCPQGLHFNTVLNVCDYPEDAKCSSTS